jgi:hypothetical protein
LISSINAFAARSPSTASGCLSPSPARSQQLGGFGSSDRDRVVAELLHDRRPFAPKASRIRVGHFGEGGVVSGPREDVVGEVRELFAPARVVG